MIPARCARLINHLRVSHGPLHLTQEGPIASLVAQFGDTLRRGGRVAYVGAGTAGVLGFIDASECPPTYGAAFDDVRGFVVGGWASMGTREAGMPALKAPAASHAHAGATVFALDDEFFEAEVLPSLGATDLVVLLSITSTVSAGASQAKSCAALDTQRVAIRSSGTQ